MPSAPSPAPASKHTGTIVGVIALVLLAIVAGLYLWGRRVDVSQDSSDISSIESDLNAADVSSTDFSGLDDIQ
jgi:hypothetical protein